MPADPIDGCEPLMNKELIQGQVILLERGYVGVGVCSCKRWNIILECTHLMFIYNIVYNI